MHIIISSFFGSVWVMVSFVTCRFVRFFFFFSLLSLSSRLLWPCICFLIWQHFRALPSSSLESHSTHRLFPSRKLMPLGWHYNPSTFQERERQGCFPCPGGGKSSSQNSFSSRLMLLSKNGRYVKGVACKEGMDIESGGTGRKA